MQSKIRSTETAVCFLAFAALVFCSLHPATARAQVAGATLSGTVTDQSAAVIPQATISAKNVDTGITRTSVTSAAGFYSIPNLLPGSYEVRTSAQGFSSQVKAGITLTVGEQQVLDFTLQVGQTNQTVVVTTEAPNVELASSSISATVNSTTVRELPLNGRSWQRCNRVSVLFHKSRRTLPLGAIGATEVLEIKSLSRVIARNKIITGWMVSASMISTMPRRAACWVATWVWMRSRSFPSLQATFPPSTAGPRAALLTPLHVPERISSMEALTSFSATTPWMPRISLRT
jgi:hypothetical protein